MTVSVLFVCLGNICRSPTAHGVFQAMVERSGLYRYIEIDSAGTGDWHIGHPPDRRATAAARTRGYDLSPLRARLVTPDDFRRFDYVLAMDANNLADLKQLQPDDGRAHLALMLSFAKGQSVSEVPDPYYGGDDGFDRVLDLLENACDGLLAHIREQHPERLG